MSFFDVAGHGEINGAIFIVPVQISAKEFSTCPVVGDFTDFI